MARIRTIKPSFFRHEALQDLEAANPGCYVMLVFAALFGHCDKAGRFLWKPRTLKLDILPFLDFDLAKTLGLLKDAGMLRHYAVDGHEYGVIDSFVEHQRIGGKEAQEPVKYPEPPSESSVKQQGINSEADVNNPENNGEASGKHQGSIGEASGKHQGLQEGNKEGNKEGGDARTRATPELESPFSDDFMTQIWPKYLKTKVGKPYKNRESQEVALRQLWDYCAGDEVEAINALREAIANGWQGFKWYFEHKKRNGNGTTTTNGHGEIVISDKQRQNAEFVAHGRRRIEAARAREATDGAAS